MKFNSIQSYVINNQKVWKMKEVKDLIELSSYNSYLPKLIENQDYFYNSSAVGRTGYFTENGIKNLIKILNNSTYEKIKDKGFRLSLCVDLEKETSNNKISKSKYLKQEFTRLKKEKELLEKENRELKIQLANLQRNLRY